jgi:hypothetical protein
MQPNNTNNKWKIFGIVVGFLCLICVVIGGIGYFYASNQPPSTITSGSGYYIRWTKVYYLGGFPSTAFEIEGADVSTFEILDEAQVYARDKNQVYFHGHPIPGADSATFELLESPYSRDKNHVYVSDVIHSNDPANFEFVNGYLMRDSEHIYWSQEIISDDPSNLIIIDDLGFYTYWKDSKNIFINGSPIEAANIETFEIIADAYSHDATYVFYHTEIISQADVTTFEVLEPPYAKDNTAVFWMEQILPNADPQSFRILNVKFQCSADSQTAYYQGDPIPNFDPNIIPATSQVTNCDINGLYFSP